MEKPSKPNEVLTDKELTFQKSEYCKQTAALINANNEVALQKIEKGKRAAELIIANKELAFQNKEKEKRAAELQIASKELIFQNSEKEKRAAELVIADAELVFQGEEKEKRAAELNIAYKELKKGDEYLREYIAGLEKMMFITSHKVRQPVANILGLSGMLDQFIHSPESLKKMIDYLQVSALILDTFVTELTAFISDLEVKGRKATSFKQE